jgi:hypothetical protein
LPDEEMNISKAAISKNNRNFYLSSDTLYFWLKIFFQALLFVKRRRGRIAQSDQPVGRLFGQASSHQGTVSFVQPTRSHPVVMPESENGKQISREVSVDSQVGAKDAVPVLHG